MLDLPIQKMVINMVLFVSTVYINNKHNQYVLKHLCKYLYELCGNKFKYYLTEIK